MNIARFRYIALYSSEYAPQHTLVRSLKPKAKIKRISSLVRIYWNIISNGHIFPRQQHFDRFWKSLLLCFGCLPRRKQEKFNFWLDPERFYSCNQLKGSMEMEILKTFVQYVHPANAWKSINIVASEKLHEKFNERLVYNWNRINNQFSLDSWEFSKHVHQFAMPLINSLQQFLSSS